jgi:hypothetical protein
MHQNQWVKSIGSDTIETQARRNWGQTTIMEETDFGTQFRVNEEKDIVEPSRQTTASTATRPSRTFMFRR